jgi:hypothetical protein
MQIIDLLCGCRGDSERGWCHEMLLKICEPAQCKFALIVLCNQVHASSEAACCMIDNWGAQLRGWINFSKVMLQFDQNAQRRWTLWCVRWLQTSEMRNNGNQPCSEHLWVWIQNFLLLLVLVVRVLLASGNNSDSTSSGNSTCWYQLELLLVLALLSLLPAIARSGTTMLVQHWYMY